MSPANVSARRLGDVVRRSARYLTAASSFGVWLDVADCAPAALTVRRVCRTLDPVTKAPDRYWRAAEPKAAYDVVIVGAGGHGLATAYYLAKNHGITDICVVEKGWLGGGNMARNTTVIRSNYLWDESAAIYEHSLKLWEGLEEALEFDMQFSQRGVLNLVHDLGDRRSSMRRVDAEWLEASDVKDFCPVVNVSPPCGTP